MKSIESSCLNFPSIEFGCSFSLSKAQNKYDKYKPSC